VQHPLIAILSELEEILIWIKYGNGNTLGKVEGIWFWIENPEEIF
jgi:hypothetical protein